MDPHHIRNVLITEEQIRERVRDIVVHMAEDCRSDNFVMIGILRGSFMFFADLVRELNRDGIHGRVDFMMLASYGSGTASSGQVEVVKDCTEDLTGADVFIVDDILDSGRTLAFAKEHVMSKGARSCRACVLLDKPSRRVNTMQAEHVGFTIEDEFVVGYGLDYNNFYRELPYIARVTFEADGNS
ncbi:MAG: hypoxanthine phosphoribosyltransferase [Spartobacteria bacterium]|nr:hypoxanthine phosphoribosyltransferase [Spartobacteria bacterium]